MITNPWFAGIHPETFIAMAKAEPDATGDWGSWLCLTEHEAHHLMMQIEVECLRRGVWVHLYASPLQIEGHMMATPAWSISAKVYVGGWIEVI